MAAVQHGSSAIVGCMVYNTYPRFCLFPSHHSSCRFLLRRRMDFLASRHASFAIARHVNLVEKKSNSGCTLCRRADVTYILYTRFGKGVTYILYT